MPRELPQGTVTILFTDAVESTALATARGDERAHVILQRQRALIRQQIEEHDGREVKTMGDGFMVAFVSARQGVACAIGIQRALDQQARHDAGAALQVRVGLNTGEAIVEGGDLFGSVVNAAARVMHKATGGQVLVSESVHAVLGAATEFQLADRGRFRLKGFPERLRLYEVLWRPDAQAAATPPLDASPFVRREQELARLALALEQASGGRGSLLLIGGEAGVGKTRLAEECAIEAQRRGVLAFTGRCYEDAGGPPYGPFVEILEALARKLPPDALKEALGDAAAGIMEIAPALSRLFPDVQPAAEKPAFATQSPFAAVRAFLARAGSTHPLLLVLEDLQWADAASLQFLRFLARDLRALPVAVIATYRDDALDARSSISQALDELHVKRLATEIDLKPFGVDAVEALLQATSGRQPPRAVVRLLHAETNGNAFFIEELYRHLAEEGRLFDEAGEWRPVRRIDEDALPKGLRLVIERRLSRLDAATRRTLNAAAILGSSFDVDLLETVSTTRGDQLLDCLDEAERAQIIRPDADGTDARFRFAHPLMRSAIVSALASAQRQRLHVRAAAAFEGRADRSPVLDAELARHYRAAGRLADPLRAIAALRRAGGTALDAYANVEAIGHFEAALKLAERLPGFATAELADIVHHRGQAQYRLGDWSRSRESLDRALALYTEAGSVPGQAQVLYSKSSLATFDSSPSDALLFLARARDLMPDDQPLKALALQLESQNLVDLRRYADAARAVDEALAIADSVDDAYVRNHARIASGYYALATLDMPRAVDDFSRVSEAKVALQHERMAAASRRAIALACMGELDAAAAGGAYAREYFRSMREADDVFSDSAPERDPYEFGLSCMAEGITTIVRGRFSDAYQFLLEAMEACGDPPNVRVVQTLTPMTVQALYHLGRYDEATSLLQIMGGPANGRRPAFWRLYHALELAARGDDTGAVADLPVPPPNHPDIRSLPVAMLAAETAVARRDADAARLQVDALEFLHEHGLVFTPGWVVLTSRLLGAVYILIGSELRAAPVLEAALSLARSQGASAELALTHLELAELHAARADTAASRADLAEAEKLFSALGMRSCGARVRALARRLRPVAPLADGLTEQEADILRAVASGLTNRAIALEHARSEHAIQRQLTAIYRKIGVENRVAAIAYAYRNRIARDGE